MYLLKKGIADQIDLVVGKVSPYREKLSVEDQNDLRDLEKCQEILRQENYLDVSFVKTTEAIGLLLLTTPL